jgi:hypothetical protein
MLRRFLYLGCLAVCLLVSAYGQTTFSCSALPSGYDSNGKPFHAGVRIAKTVILAFGVTITYFYDFYPSGQKGKVEFTSDGHNYTLIDDTDANSEIKYACPNGVPGVGPFYRRDPGSPNGVASQTGHRVRESGDRTTAAIAPLTSGTANQGLVSFNGVGTIDSALITSSGIAVNVSNSDGTLLSTTTYPVAGIGASILVADFDGDGIQDLAATQNGTSGPGNVVVLLGKSDGSFGPPKAFPAGSFPFYLTTGDFNGDGVPDLAVTNLSATLGTAGAVTVLLGKGDGTFAPAVSYPVGEFAGTIVAADFNGDGNVDLAALDTQMGIANYTNKVWVLLGRGNGTFKPALSTATGTGSGYLSFADVNNDGNVDLIIADEFASAMAIMLGKGDGTFQPSKEYVSAAQTVVTAPIPLTDGTTSIFSPDAASNSLMLSFIETDGTVDNPQLLTVGVGPASIAAADLNGDQKADLVITDAEAGKIYVELATGAGLFASPVTYSLGTQPGALALADVNGDGKPDVIAGDATGIDVLLGKGDGTLDPVKTFPAGGSLSSVTIADFNSDGKPDVAAANAASGGVSLFLGNGDGTFQGVRTIALTGSSVPLSTVTGDFNGDGKPDLIVAFSQSDPTQPGGIAVLLGKGDGTFRSPANITLPGPLATAALIAGDFNGDGKLDIAVVINGPTSNQVVVLLGKGDGTFQPPVTTNTNTAPPMMVATDLNGDGKLDLLLADCCGLSEASYLLGNGDGTFQPEVTFPSGPNPRGIAVADFGNDGLLGIAVIGQVQQPDRGTLAIMFNPFTAPTSAASTTTAAASVSATYSPNSQSITLSATVTSNSTPVTGGTVTFTLLNTSVSAAVTSGTASTSFTIPGATAAGTYAIQASYNPASGFAASSDNTQQLTISKATPVITWANPASIVSGTALGSTQLDATANVSGAFTYTPPSGTVLPVGNNQTLSVLFTPMDTTDYNTQTATVSINVTAPNPPGLTISKTHSASFTAGASGAYMIAVGNMASAGSTSGTVTVTDNAPAGLSVTAMSGTGWSCLTLPTCTRSDTLTASQSYPVITVTVSVASNAPSSLTNMAAVSGGGSASATASDVTSIGSAPQFAFTWTANPPAGGAVTPASGSLYTMGSNITVSATPSACYAFSSWGGALSGNTNPTTLLMNAAESVVANFTSTAKTNVTSQMTSTVSGFRYNRFTHYYLQSLTVTNNGATLSGPVYVALDSLTGNATLVGSLGTTQCAAPVASPYVLLSNGLGAGQSISLTLQFTSAAGPPFIYTPRYLAGSGLE